MSTADTDFEFDATLSFAGEDRAYVEEVAETLKSAGIRAFLDDDSPAGTGDQDPAEFFDSVFRTRSRFVILFLSLHYADQAWARPERRDAILQAVEERPASVLSVRLDDSPIDGLHLTAASIDSRRIGIAGVAEALLAALDGGASQPEGWPGGRVPRTQREVDDVLAAGPPAWEYLYFAGVLHLEKEALEEKYFDHELKYASPSGERVKDQDAALYLRQTADEIRGLVLTLGDMMSPEVQERAFGAPGIAGDPDRLKRLAMRWAFQYGALMDWASRVRGAIHSETFDDAFELLAQFAAQPVADCRQFLDDLVAQFDRIPAAIAAQEPLHIDLPLTLTIEEGLVERFATELARLAGQ